MPKCSACQCDLTRDLFSSAQLKKSVEKGRKCKSCVIGGASTANIPATADTPEKKHKKNEGNKAAQAQTGPVMWEDQSPSKREDTLLLLKTRLATLDIPGVEVVVFTKSLYDGFSLKATVKHSLIIEGSVSTDIEQQEALQRFVVYCKSLCREVQVEVSQADAANVGEQAPAGEAVDHTGTAQSLLEAGHVTCLLFWSSGSEDSLDPVYKFKCVAEERADRWGGKVHLTAVSLDYTLETMNKYIKEEEINSDHLRYLWVGPDDVETPPQKPTLKVQVFNLKSNSIVQDYDVDSMPLCLLLDAHGKVVKRGNYESFNFVNDIDRLLQNGGVFPTAPSGPIEGLDNFTNHPATSRAGIVTRACAQLNQHSKSLSGVVMEVISILSFSTAAGHSEEHSLSLSGEVGPSSERDLCSLIYEIERTGRVSDLRKEVTLTPRPIAIHFKPSTKCGSCANLLKGQGWQCAICPRHLSCDACFASVGGIHSTSDEKSDAKPDASDANDNPAKGHLKHHPFFRVTPASADSIDSIQHNRGITVLPDYYRSGLPLHVDTSCDGCGKGPIEGSRFKCAVCADMDLCAACFLSLEQGADSSPPAAACASHVFLLVPDSSLCDLDDDDEGDEGDDVQD